MIPIDTYILKSSCCAVNSANGGGGGGGGEGDGERKRELPWTMKTKTLYK